MRATPWGLVAGLALVLVAGHPATLFAQRTGWDTTTAVADLPLTAAERQAFVGRYRVTLPQESGYFAFVEEEQGRLRLCAEASGECRRMLHQGRNVFLFEGVPDFEVTFVVENGRATRFALRKADGPGDGVRVP